MWLFSITVICSVYLLHGGDVNDLIPSGTKFYCQSNGYPRKMFWKACIWCAHVGLSNSKPCWHHRNKILNNIVHNRATRNWRPWRQKHKRKGKPVSVERKQGECYQWKAKGQCTRGDAHTFPPRWERAHPHLLQNRRREAMVKILRKESLKRQSPSGKRSRRPCTDYISGKCTNPSSDPGTLYVKTESGCKCLTKDPKRMVVKIL